MKRYYNRKEHVYYNEGSSMTRRIDEGTLFSGVPSEEQLRQWGFVEYEAPVLTSQEQEQERIQARKAAIVQELSSMDYLTSKYIDGEDMTEYGDWQSRRKALREEYRNLEKELSDGAS